MMRYYQRYIFIHSFYNIVLFNERTQHITDCLDNFYECENKNNYSLLLEAVKDDRYMSMCVYVCITYGFNYRL